MSGHQRESEKDILALSLTRFDPTSQISGRGALVFA
jgi:hypothetical protein